MGFSSCFRGVLCFFFRLLVEMFLVLVGSCREGFSSVFLLGFEGVLTRAALFEASGVWGIFKRAGCAIFPFGKNKRGLGFFLGFFESFF